MTTIRKIAMRWMASVFVLSTLLLFIGTAFAQTPDAETPAVETVCDGAGLTGAAWGLCNAYCEAMDCDSDPQASDDACDRVYDEFYRIAGDEPPCETTCLTGELC